MIRRPLSLAIALIACAGAGGATGVTAGAAGVAGIGTSAARTRAPAHVAQYADVVAAIKNQNLHIHQSGALRKLAQLLLDTPAHARSALPVLAQVRGTFAFAAADVAHASIQSPVQRVARHKWVKGTRDQAGGVAEFETAAREIADGHMDQARPHLLHATKLFEEGAAKTYEAESLLDLAHNTRLPRLHGG